MLMRFSRDASVTPSAALLKRRPCPSFSVPALVWSLAISCQRTSSGGSVYPSSEYSGPRSDGFCRKTAQLDTQSQNSSSLCGSSVSWSAFSLLRLNQRVFAAGTSMMPRNAAYASSSM